MLPDAKERAVMDLYKEAKKLELTRKCSHEASTNFQKMRAQLARRVSNLQTAVAAEAVRNKEIIVTMKRGQASQVNPVPASARAFLCALFDTDIAWVSVRKPRCADSCKIGKQRGQSLKRERHRQNRISRRKGGECME